MMTGSEMNNWLLYSVVESLQPTFAEYVVDKLAYWDRYHTQLELIKRMDYDAGSLIIYLNMEMNLCYSSSPEHHASTDVALTLQGINPSLYTFKFK